MLHRLVLSALVLGIVGASAQTIPNTVTFRNFFKVGSDSLTFNRPVSFIPYPGVDSAYVIVQQNGRLVTVRRVGTAWAKTDSAVLTVTAGTSGGSEQGLLGMTFHPNWAVNRKYYIYYVSGGGTTGNPWYDVIAERIADVSGRPKTSDAQRTIFKVADPYNNHNSGTIKFGSDGYFYFGIGDGGDGGDPQNRAQNTDSLLGKFHRIDVDGADAYPADTTKNYAIPADNPFVGMAGYRPEIWAYGLRNPWKWSFDPITDQIWVGDVGQNLYEDVSRVLKGNNMGWRIREGAFCYNATTCTSTGLTAPGKTFRRAHAASITGGVLFTGDPTSAYHGVYIVGDYVTDHVWAMRPFGGVLNDSVRIGSMLNVVSFDRDHNGRVFATRIGSGGDFAINNNTGAVFLLESPDMKPAPVGVRGRAQLGLKPFHLAEVLNHPERYEVRALDGALLQGRFTGMAWVREKGSAAAAQLMTAW